MNLSEKIKEYRKSLNMTQEELAERLDVTRQAVTKWENGASLPDTNHLLRIAKIFNVPVEKITGDRPKGLYAVTGNKICSYCGNKAEFYRDESLNEAYCSPKCQQLHTDAMKRIRKHIPWFCLGIGLSVILLLAGAFIRFPMDKKILVGGGLLLLGGTLLLFPFCTPEAYQRYGYVKTTKIGRVLGFLTEAAGLAVLVLG